LVDRYQCFQETSCI